MHSPATPCIGVFDSGVGGLSVLAALREALPGTPLHYLADSLHAPYGEREPPFIRARSLAIAKHLRASGCELLVIACNTATACAAEALRNAHPGWPVVGIEPGVKPAVLATRVGRIGVLATRATVQSERFHQLVAQHAGSTLVVPVACNGVVAHIERGDLDSPALRALIDRHCQPLRDAGVDVALLGCTHYPLIRPLWQDALPGVQLLAIEEAVAQQAKRLWPFQANLTPASVSLCSTGDAALLLRIARQALSWQDARASHVRVE